jgi:hypothetical protein
LKYFFIELIYNILLFALAIRFKKSSKMSAFDLTQYNNIKNMLTFKKYNEPSLYYDVNKNLSYTTWCLSKYTTMPKSDYVVITYTYWHNENGYEECKQNENKCDFIPMVVLGHEYDKDVQEDWDYDGYRVWSRGCYDDEDEDRDMRDD